MLVLLVVAVALWQLIASATSGNIDDVDDEYLAAPHKEEVVINTGEASDSEPVVSDDGGSVDIDAPGGESPPRQGALEVQVSGEAMEFFEKGRAAMEINNMLRAREYLSRAIGLKLAPAEQAEAYRWLNQAADDWLFSRNIHTSDDHCRLRKIASGDNLAKIGKELNVPHQLLARINGISGDRIAAGEHIKVVKGPFHAKIDCSEFLMIVYLGDSVVRTYPVTLGKADRETPSGKWMVTVKTVDPSWTDHELGKHYLGGDPENPLGTRWIALKGLEGPAKDRSGFGIHGTVQPDEIGKATSRGCIRLRNEDVEELYDLVTPEKTTVTVVG